MNHHAAYRLEIHAMESGSWFAQIYEAENDNLKWESPEYEDMDGAYDAGKYELDQRAESDREARVLARLGPDDRPGESEKD